MAKCFGVVDPPAEPHFRGYRTSGGVVIVKGAGGQALSPRFDLWNHSPDGFEWGYGGSGPAQLALAMLAYVAQNDELAVRLHQRFKRDFIASLPKESWYITLDAVRAWIVETVTAQVPELEEMP